MGCLVSKPDSSLQTWKPLSRPVSKKMTILERAGSQKRLYSEPARSKCDVFHSSFLLFYTPRSLLVAPEAGISILNLSRSRSAQRRLSIPAGSKKMPILERAGSQRRLFSEPARSKCDVFHSSFLLFIRPDRSWLVLEPGFQY